MFVKFFYSGIRLLIKNENKNETSPKILHKIIYRLSKKLVLISINSTYNYHIQWLQRRSYKNTENKTFFSSNLTNTRLNEKIKKKKKLRGLYPIFFLLKFFSFFLLRRKLQNDFACCMYAFEMCPKVFTLIRCQRPKD